MTLESLLAMSRTELMKTLRAGHAIAPEALADTEYLGVSLGLPGWVDRLAWKTFMKTFHSDDGVLRGWNVRLEQDGIEAVPRPKTKGAEPITFGHYKVRPMGAGESYPGLMLDYGAGGNGWWDPAGFLRDPLVALHPEQTDLLLGWSYVRLAGLSIGTPSFFALRKVGPLSHCIKVPSGR